MSSIAFAAAAQPPESAARRPVPATRATSAPAIDGDIGEEAWKQAPMATGFWDFRNGNQNMNQTTAWIMMDDKYIYVAFDCRDDRPDEIVARETVKNSRFASNGDETEDWVDFRIDPFNTRSGGDTSLFSINPMGTLSSRIAGGRANKTEWQGDWIGAAKRTESGWTAEIRIPWAILNYPTGKNPVTMGINFFRFQKRTEITSCWSNVGPQFYSENQGEWQAVVPPAPPRPNVSLLPYVLPSVENGRFHFRSGLDARYPVTPELTVVGALNPDFATIEGAVEGIQFTRSERFIPERRPFFLEGDRFFRAGDEFGLGILFYPRRIASFDLGTKVYGKVTPKDSVGLLHTITFQERSDLVAKYRHDLNPRTDFNVFFSNKTSRDEENTVGYFDAETRTGKLNLEGSFGLSGGGGKRGEASMLSASYSDRNLMTYLQATGVTPDFDAANGLIGFTGYRGFLFYSEWGAEFRSSPLRGFQVETAARWDWDSDGKPFRRSGSIDASFITRSDWLFAVGMDHGRFRDEYDGTYGFAIRKGVTNRFAQLGIRGSFGTIEGEKYTFLGPTASYRIFRHLDISVGSAIQNLGGVNQQHIVTTSYELSPTSSIGGRLVVRNGQSNWYLSYRKAGAKGAELYVLLGDPNAAQFSSKFTVKLVWPF
ncbi:MAG TPA: carbohydrate binding family 9 domain-containing protein [Fimbriimonadaceae bacterium]|nr:carbohydrate binding family 9 domain-containing protein [Fimbriimonadaceae bacterium]